MVISFDQNARNSISSPDYSVPRVGATSSAEQPDPSNQERLDLLSDNHGSISYPGTEIRSDASLQYFSENDLIREDQSEDRLEPDWELMEEIMEQTEADTLADELVPAVSPPPQQHQQPTSVMSEQDLEFLNSDNVCSHKSPTLEIHSTPPPQQTMPEQRIQSHHYDHITILSNRLMKKRIIDCNGILRTKKERPRDALASWRLNKRLKKDAIFFEPLLTETDSGIFRAILKGNIDFKSEPWPSISDGAKDLIRKMLDSSDLRPTAKQVWKSTIGILEVGTLNVQGLSPMKTKDGRATTDAYCVAKYGQKWESIPASSCPPPPPPPSIFHKLFRKATRAKRIHSEASGRWIDFMNDYKTMDLKFVESVWWVFSRLHKKGLVYRGFKQLDELHRGGRGLRE
ncbi:hypothetical protein AgCh_002413 [Apium graveolens]